MNWWQFWFEVILRSYRRIGALGREMRARRGRIFVIGVPMVWLGVLFALPLMIVVGISFAEVATAQPPYTRLLDLESAGYLNLRLYLGNYALLIEDPFYLNTYLSSLKVAAVTTVLTLLIGYPLALGIARAPERWRLPLIMLVVLPFWTSFLLRIYAWIGLLNPNGTLNQVLLGLGLIDAPLQLLHSTFSLYLGLVYCYLPFMVLPLVATLIRMDQTLIEAAADLGARPLRTFVAITLPLSMPGVIAGSLLVFIPVVGEYVVPELLGDKDTTMIGKLLWTEFFYNGDWPLASALTVAMLLFIVVPILVFEHVQNQRRKLEGEG